MQILIIEDDPDIVALIYAQLEAEGHILDSAGDGVTGLHRAVTSDFDVIILDLNLPGMNGIELCKKLRTEANNNVPVLMLTSATRLDDKIEAFDAGVDDYLLKPFAPKELSARLKALVRRSQPSESRRMEVADLSLDLDMMHVERAGRRLRLSPIGIQILELLMRESPKVVTRGKIEEAIWGDTPPDSDALRAHIYSLRNTIDRHFEVKLLETVPRKGYRLSEEKPRDAH